ncbi:MAG: hypothetical protein Kow0068_06170 [Marinilabiliales bacterium]
MKNLILMFVFIFIVTSSLYSQHKKKRNDSSKKNENVATWFFLTGAGSVGNSLMLNDQIGNTDMDMSYVNVMNSFDIDIGANFPFNAGIMIGLGKSTYGQKFTYNDQELKLALSSFDTYFLLRGYSNGPYVEIGPKFSKLTKIPSLETKNQYRERQTSILFGFGGSLYWHKNFDVSLGARLSYTFAIMEEDNYPFTPIYSSSGFDAFSQTSMFQAQLRLSLCWHIGYFATAHCDRHGEFLLF